MNSFLKKIIGFIPILVALHANAELKIGSKDGEYGELDISGIIRAKYQHKDFRVSTQNNRIEFDVAILNINYDSQKWFGRMEYRCYQTDKFCDFSIPVDGYMGYKLNNQDNLTLGLQPLPFGPGQFWDNSFYESINSTLGLQDIHNVGLKYHFELLPETRIDLAYFVTDGGNYYGNSHDSSRYSSNVVTSSDPLKTNLNEKNMWVARIDQDLKFLSTDDLKVSVGGSYWYSDIENKKTSTDGNRNTWAVFNRINYKNLNVVLTGGRQSISNEDTLSPASSTFGSFDSEYDIANKGYFYTVDTSYTFKNVKDSLNVTPYVVFSGFNKKEQGFDDSQRNIVGVAWDYKNVSLYTEYLMSKNDPFVGGTGSSLAAGDDGKWNKLLNVMLVYNF
ncbi:hypothetical protein ABFO74_00350 [Acinetobacter baumannii]